MFKKTSGAIVVGLLFFRVALAQTSSSPQDLLAIIKQLQAQVASLQAQVAALTTQVASSTKEIEAVKTELAFTKTLKRGMTGDDVKKLQEFLKQFPDIYPEGLVTGYYGAKTEAAVRKLQEKEGVEAVGAVGPKTLTKLNELAATGAGQSGVIPPSAESAGKPGLLVAPGAQNKIATTTATTAASTSQITSSTIATLATTTATTVSTSTVSSSTIITTTATATTTQAYYYVPPPSSSGAGGGGLPPSPTPPSAPTSTSTSSSVDTTLPSTPANLTAVNRNAWSIDLSWSVASNTVGVTSYAIYRDTVHIADVGASTYSFSDVNTPGDGSGPGGVTFSYNVKAYNGTTYSPASNSVSITNTFTSIACLSATNNGSDSYRTQGSVTTVDGNTYTDICLDSSIIRQGGVNLKKAYCDGSDGDPVSSRNFRIDVVSCAYGCSNGTCNAAPAALITSTSNLASVSESIKSLGVLLQQIQQVITR